MSLFDFDDDSDPAFTLKGSVAVDEETGIELFSRFRGDWIYRDTGRGLTLSMPALVTGKDVSFGRKTCWDNGTLITEDDREAILSNLRGACKAHGLRFDTWY